jgi:UTP--glucose-1-phosphate uridylyltransferase
VKTLKSEALGLGHAVLMAKELVGDEPFAVILPDDIVDTKVGYLKQMVEAFEETHSSILGTEVVEGDAISLYGCLDCEPTRPTPACWRSGTWSKSRSRRTRQVRNAIIGRYILTPRIFEMIEQLKPSTCGELQLTDAIKALLEYEKVYGFHYVGKRYDAGDRLGFLKATVELAVKHKDLGPAFRDWLQKQSF